MQNFVQPKGCIGFKPKFHETQILKPHKSLQIVSIFMVLFFLRAVYNGANLVLFF